MHAWEWVVVDGTFVKTDAVDHHAAHDLVGCQDLAWDIAGASHELGLELDELATRTSTYAGRHVGADVLAFAQRAGRVLDREQLLQFLHGTADEAFDRSIDVVISRLRHKIEVDARNPRLLKTIRGAGYMLTPGER